MHEHGWKFGAIYAGLFFVTIAATVALGLQLTANPVTHSEVQNVADQAQQAVAAVAGEQNLVALCESAITQSISQGGGEVKGYRKVSVKQKGNTATVVVNVNSNLYQGNAKCDFNRSNWTVSNLGPS